MGERRELQVLLASVKESEKKKKESENSEKEIEREPPRHAGESFFEEGKRQRKKYGEIKSEEK